jgi:hypothetical protein
MSINPPTFSVWLDATELGSESLVIFYKIEVNDRHGMNLRVVIYEPTLDSGDIL